MLIKIKLLDGGREPSYQTPGAAGTDLYACESGIIKAGERLLVSTGVCIEIPDGYEAQIRPRSGLAIKNGIGLLNSPGTIDSDYRGEIKVILFNFSNEDFAFSKGDRIAQMVFAKVEKAYFEVVAELNQTQRGEGGFGSTGVKG